MAKEETKIADRILKEYCQVEQRINRLKESIKKLEEMREDCANTGVDLVAFDEEVKDKNLALSREIAKLTLFFAEVSQIINTFDELTQKIFELRYKKSWGWDKIAMECYCCRTSCFYILGRLKSKIAEEVKDLENEKK